jgi:hypothetical protein
MTSISSLRVLLMNVAALISGQLSSPTSMSKTLKLTKAP